MTTISGSAPACGHGPGGVILAVGAGEDGDEHPGLGGLDERVPSGCRVS